MVRLQPTGFKRQAGGMPNRAADTWCLVARPERWAGHALGCSHLTLGLPSLGYWGQTRAPGCSPRLSGSAPRPWGLQTHTLGADPVAEFYFNRPWI